MSRQGKTNYVTQQQLNTLRVKSGGSGHIHTNKEVLDSITALDILTWDSAAENSHTHDNKEVLDTITQDTLTELGRLSALSHSHSNKLALDLIQYNPDTKTIVIGDSNNPINFAAYGEVTAYGPGEGEGAATHLYMLKDVPDYRTLYRGKYLRVKSDGSGTEWVDVQGGVTAFDNLTGRPSYNGVAMTSATNIPEVRTSYWNGKQDALGYTPVNKAGDTITGTTIAIDSTGLPTYGGSRVPANTLAIGRNGIGIGGVDTSNDGAAIYIENAGTEKNHLIIALGDNAAQLGADDYIAFRYYNTSGQATFESKIPFKSGTIALTSDIPTSLPANGGTATNIDGGYVSVRSNSYYGSGYGIQMNNSDIIGCNSIRFGDLSDDWREGLCFYRNDGYWDSFWAQNGTAYFTHAGINTTIIHSGNIGSQSVAYASSAGNTDTVDGEHASAFAHIGAHNNLTANGNEFTFAPSAFSGAIYFNYRTAGGLNGNITDYYFSNGKGGMLVALSTLISQSSHGETAYDWGNHASYGYATQTWTSNNYHPKGGSSSLDFAARNINANGNIRATGEVAAYSSSDSRFKDKQSDLINPDAVLKALRPMEFNWNSLYHTLGGGRKGRDVGFIAQQVQPLIPSAIGEIYGGYLSLDYTRITPYLVAGWQSHEKRIEQLEREVFELKKRVVEIA